MRKMLVFWLLGFSGALLFAAPAQKDSTAQKTAVAQKYIIFQPDTTAKKDTAAIKKDTLARKDTSVAKAPAVRPDSAKAGADSAALAEEKILSECVGMDPVHPISPRKFDEVNGVLGRRVGKVMSHYLDLFAQNKALRGKLVINFVISAEGKVTFSKIIENSLKNRDLEDRALEAVSQALFPAIDKGTKPVLVRYPLYFFPW